MGFTDFLRCAEHLEGHEKEFVQWWLQVTKKPRGKYSFQAVADFLERQGKTEYHNVAGELWSKWRRWENPIG